MGKAIPDLANLRLGRFCQKHCDYSCLEEAMDPDSHETHMRGFEEFCSCHFRDYALLMSVNSEDKLLLTAAISFSAPSSIPIPIWEVDRYGYQPILNFMISILAPTPNIDDAIQFIHL